MAVLNQKEIGIDEVGIGPAHIASLVNAVCDKKITGKQAKEVFACMIESGKMPDLIIAEKGMSVVSDNAEIERLIREVLEQNERAIADYKSGKSNAFGWLMGQVMKQSSGKANPASASALLKAELDKR